jgi:Glucodextranase, domain B/FecR protein
MQTADDRQDGLSYTSARMAKRGRSAGTETIDWYLISIDRLKQIGLVVLLLLLGGGAWWFWSNQKGNPRTLAEAAMADARSALNELAASKDIQTHRSELDKAQKKLDEAGTLFTSGKYAEAKNAADESLTISRTARSGGEGDSDARFLTVEGDVQVRKGQSSDWRAVDIRMPLMNGDWVKTSDSASAELMFTNGSVYTIGPNALLEIYSQINPSTARKNNAIQMQVGSVEVATTDDASTVRTPGSQVIVDSESTTQVGVDQAKATSVVAMKGSAAVTSTAGGEPVKIGSGEKVTATPEGSLSPVKKLTQPPALIGPADNQVFQITADSRVNFGWEPVQGASAYQLEVSRSRLFSTLEINARRPKTSAEAKVTAEGTFYWRVASVGADGDLGPFSPFRRFRVSGGGKGPSNQANDTTPPVLTLKNPYPIGGQFFIIEGTTEPGATVFINNEEVEVESNGHFKKLISLNKVGRNDIVIKAVDPAGNPTIQSQTVLVNEE